MYIFIIPDTHITQNIIKICNDVRVIEFWSRSPSDSTISETDPLVSAGS